jgi:hypothetical protein
MPLNPKVEITQTGVHGFCWFAKEDFKAGEWIWKQREDGPRRHRTTTARTQAHQRWCRLTLRRLCLLHVCVGAPHTDVFLTYEQINALSEEKRTKWLSLAYQVDDNLMCGFDPDKEPLYEELIVRKRQRTLHIRHTYATRRSSPFPPPLPAVHTLFLET